MEANRPNKIEPLKETPAAPDLGIPQEPTPSPQESTGIWTKLLSFLANKEHGHLSDRVVAACTIVLALSAFIQLILMFMQWDITRRTLNEMERGGRDTSDLAQAAKDQAAASRLMALNSLQALKGTQAAVLECSPGLDYEHSAVHFACENRGKVIATGLEASFTISLQTLPNQTQLGPEITGTFSSAQIPMGSGEQVLTQVFIPEMAQARSNLENAKQTITVQAQYRYDNGFGDLIRLKSCQSYLAYRQTSADGRSTSSSSGFVPCHLLAGRLHAMDVALQ
jgi:hypothetical protein